MPKLDGPSDILLDTSTIAGMHHRTSNAVLLPPVMRFNAEPAVDAAIQRVLELNLLCRIGTLRDYRVTEDMIVPMAAKATEDGAVSATPGR
jgi:alcohol dehydrogenase class IV